MANFLVDLFFLPACEFSQRVLLGVAVNKTDFSPLPVLFLMILILGSGIISAGETAEVEGDEKSAGGTTFALVGVVLFEFEPALF